MEPNIKGLLKAHRWKELPVLINGRISSFHRDLAALLISWVGELLPMIEHLMQFPWRPDDPTSIRGQSKQCHVLSDAYHFYFVWCLSSLFLISLCCSNFIWNLCSQSKSMFCQMPIFVLFHISLCCLNFILETMATWG